MSQGTLNLFKVKPYLIKRLIRNYLEPGQTSFMKPFTKIVTGFRLLIISEKSVFTDVCQGSKILNWSLHLIMDICDVLRYLVPFSQFRKREKNYGEALL